MSSNRGQFHHSHPAFVDVSFSSIWPPLANANFATHYAAYCMQIYVISMIIDFRFACRYLTREVIVIAR